MQMYALFVDEIGSGMPGLHDEFPYFGLGGVLVRRNDEEGIKQQLREFKRTWGIEGVPLHGCEIRAHSRRFRWLRNRTKSEVIAFKTGIRDAILSMPVCVHGCIVDRAGYYKRYHSVYGRETWNMRKSAAAILLERATKLVRTLGGEKLSVYFEMAGAQEDQLFRTTYAEVREKGTVMFSALNSAKYSPLGSLDFAGILDPEAYGRKKDTELLQIADLCLYPVATSKNGAPNSTMVEFSKRRLLADDIAPSSDMGIKFYCFPETEMPPAEAGGNTKKDIS